MSALPRADLDALAAAGITVGPDGVLRSAGGREVSPAAAAILAKGMGPEAFQRGYLTAGHAADSPSVTGIRGLTPAPNLSGMPGGQPHQAEPQDFGRPYLTRDHASPSPDDAPPNNPLPPATGPAAGIYGHAAITYAANRARETSERLMPSQVVSSQPSHSRVALPPDMRAASIPQAKAVQAAGRAPGEAP